MKEDNDKKSDRKLREKVDRFANYYLSDSEDEGEEIAMDTLQKEEVAASTADLNPFEMTELEKKQLPQFAGANEGAYIQIRNHILGLWQENLQQFLSLKIAEKSIQEKYRVIVAPAFDFLRRYGFINTGVVANPNMDEQSNSFFHHKRSKVVVVGAGMSGLAAARQLHHLGFEVVVLEGRSRVGGRVNTDWSFGGGIDLGASIVTGLEGNPLTNVCNQLNTKLHPLTYECPIFDCDGKQIDKDLDGVVEKSFNSILQQSGEQAANLSPSLGEAINILWNKEMEGSGFSEEEKRKRRRLFNWHVANLEYGCAIDLKKVSSKSWDQDDSFEWAGDHCLLRNGYSSIAQEVSKGLDIRFDSKVTSIAHNRIGTDGKLKAIVTTQKESIECDIVLVTVSLGVLKSKMVEFEPPLPEWKEKSIDNLGFGLLNKVALLFPEVFWNDALDYFGQTTDDEELRGEFYLFWNLHRCMKKPVLIALMAGNAAYHSETLEKEEVVSRVMKTLQKLFGKVPQPTSSIVTRWASDEFARGSYSYIGIDSTGDDYDVLAKPVDNNLFFAGEATTRQHPATAAGAYLTGLRVAGDIYGSVVGTIKVDFDADKLFREWKMENERSPSKKRQQRRMRKRMDEDRGRMHHRRGKTGVRVRKAKFNASYSWLFDSNYKIPKKSSNPSSSSSTLNTGKSDYYNPSESKKRMLDLIPTKRRPLTTLTSPTSSAPPPSPFSPPTSNQNQANSYRDSYRSPPPRNEYSYNSNSNNNNYARHLDHHDSYRNNYQNQYNYSAPSPPPHYQPTQVSRPLFPDPIKLQPFNHPPLPSASANVPVPISSTPVNPYSMPSTSYPEYNNSFASSSTLAPTTVKASKEEKAAISNVVVSHLAKELSGRYSINLPKEEFKHMARKMAHHCSEKNYGTLNREGTLSEDSKLKIKKTVSDYLKRRKEQKKSPFS